MTTVADSLREIVRISEAGYTLSSTERNRITNAADILERRDKEIAVLHRLLRERNEEIENLEWVTADSDLVIHHKLSVVEEISVKLNESNLPYDAPIRNKLTAMKFDLRGQLTQY